VFRLARRTAPWLCVVAVCAATSLSVAAPGSLATAEHPSGQPVGSTVTDPAASLAAGPSATADTGSLSTPSPRPPSAPTVAASTPLVAAATAAPSSGHKSPGARLKSATVPPSSSGLAGSAGLFEDLQYLTGSALSARLDQYVQIGAKVARFQLIWENVQSSGPGSYDWQYIDAVISGLTARGITALPVIDTTPVWARSAGCSASVCAPADPNTYATFAAAAAARYAPQGVHSWELWNEPNNPIFWQPAPSTAAYTSLLKAAYAAIHRADPAATVITGGVAPAATGGGWIAPVQFLSEIYANGGGGSFDAVGWHPYDYPAMPSDTSNNAWNQMSGTGTSARSLMVAHGDGAKRIWATEFGAPTCTGDSSCVSESQQAAIISQGYTLWRSYSWAGPLVSYMYQDIGTDQSNRENFFGFVRHDGSQKPAYAAYRTAALA
jgi:hypothetical protein